MTAAAKAMADRKTLGHLSWGGNAPPVLEPAEHDLDLFAAFVTELIVFHTCLARLPSGDTGAYPFVFQRFPKPIGVVAPAAFRGSVLASRFRSSVETRAYPMIMPKRDKKLP